MGQAFSSLLGTSPANELGLVWCKSYRTKYPGLVVLKLQPRGDLLLAGNEVGSLLLFDISLDSDSPRQVLSLTFEYGGISEICWLDGNTVAVGTTRGRIVVFSIKNELGRLAEVSSIKAHGDGAAQIAVEGLDYFQKGRWLVSVAEGVGSVRLWNVSDDGVLTARMLPKLTTSYSTPRYVGFCQGGSQLIVAFMEQSLVQVFSTEPLEIKAEFRLGKEDGYINQDHLGNALVLDSMDRLVLYNLRTGCSFYNLPSISMAPCSLNAASGGTQNDGNPYCNQGISLLGNATYVASVSKRGVIHVLRTQDGSQAGCLKIPGRGRKDIQAIHATSGSRAVLVAVSSVNVDGPCELTVWKNKDDRQVKNGPSFDRNQHSTVGVIFLCIGICLAFQMMVFLLPFPDVSAIFNTRPSSTSLSSQPLDTSSSVLSDTRSISAQPSHNFQPPITGSSQTVKVGLVGKTKYVSSAGLSTNKEVRDSASHNSGNSFTSYNSKQILQEIQ